MKAVERISPKFISCAAACRGFCKLDSILEECAQAAGYVMRGCDAMFDDVQELWTSWRLRRRLRWRLRCLFLSQ